MHRVAADADEAGALALAAGIDVELPDTIGFGAGLVERVRRGELPEELVDRAARRLLPQKAELGLLDPDWTPEALGGRRRRRRPRLGRPTARSPARWPSARSCCSTPARRCRCSAPAGRRCAGSPWSGRAPPTPRTFMGCYAFPNHVLPRHPGSGWASRCRPRSTRCGPSCPDVELVYAAGLRRAGRRPVRASPPPSPRPATPTCASPSSATWPACSATAPPARAATPRTCGCRACRRTCSSELLGHRHPGRRGRRLRPAVRAGRGARPGRRAWSRRSCPGEEGGAAIAGVLSGRVQPGGKLPVQIPRHPAGSPAPTCSRRWAPRQRRHQQPRPDAAVPVRPRPLLHHLRGRRPAGQRRRGADRRRVHRDRPGPQHRRRAPATRWCSSTCTTWSPRSPGRCGS